LVIGIAIGVFYWWQSRPATVEVDRITEIQIDSNSDGVYEGLYLVDGVSVGRFDDGNITLRFAATDVSPFP
jgi:hypothetical protein